ncbi:hypothetical protein BOQ60_07400 [Chryseobacterium sp. CH1]|nr:hypothetical protein BOQ60_07400 [Chryseobacterium sp. CH1]
MNHYLYTQFYRNKAYLMALLFLLLAGLMAIFTGKNFWTETKISFQKAEHSKKRVLNEIPDFIRMIWDSLFTI